MHLKGLGFKTERNVKLNSFFPLSPIINIFCFISLFYLFLNCRAKCIVPGKEIEKVRQWESAGEIEGRKATEGQRLRPRGSWVPFTVFCEILISCRSEPAVPTLRGWNQTAWCEKHNCISGKNMCESLAPSSTPGKQQWDFIAVSQIWLSQSYIILIPGKVEPFFSCKFSFSFLHLSLVVLIYSSHKCHQVLLICPVLCLVTPVLFCR